MMRYQGARFADGSIAVRRLSPDPCDRATLTFESTRELEDELPGREIEWVGVIGRMPSGEAVVADGDFSERIRVARQLDRKIGDTIAAQAREIDRQVRANVLVMRDAIERGRPLEGLKAGRYDPEPEGAEDL